MIVAYTSYEMITAGSESINKSRDVLYFQKVERGFC